MSESLYYPLCTVQDVRDQIGNDDGAIEDIIVRCINAASRLAEEMTGRNYRLVSKDITPYTMRSSSPYELISDAGRKFQLPVHMTPIKNFYSLVEDDVELTLNEDFFYDVNTGEFVRASGVWGEEVKIYFIGGYNTEQEDPLGGPDQLPSIPYPIRRAVIIIAANFTGNNRREMVAFGNITTLLTKEIPQEAKDLLNPYLKIVI